MGATPAAAGDSELGKPLSGLITRELTPHGLGVCLMVEKKWGQLGLVGRESESQSPRQGARLWRP